MSYYVAYSAEARQDLRDIYQYIAYELLEPEIASGQVDRIMNEISSLDEMPLRHRRYDEEPWYSIGLRVMPVDNYLVFYLPDETNDTVSIVRIMYSGRDINKQLYETT